MGDFRQFKNGAQFAARLGLAPRQNFSGANPGAITKQGDSCLRTLLVQGAKAAALTGKHNLDPISQWVIALRQRSGWQKAAVALANKNARILWALMHRSVPTKQPISANAPGHPSLPLLEPGTSTCQT